MTSPTPPCCWKSIAGHDRRDSTSVDRPVPAYHRTLDEPVEPLTIGVAREYFGEGLDAEVEAAVRAALEGLRRAWAPRSRKCRCRTARMRIATYYLVATAEASSNLARYDGVHFGHRADRITPT